MNFRQSVTDGGKDILKICWQSDTSQRDREDSICRVAVCMSGKIVHEKFDPRLLHITNARDSSRPEGDGWVIVVE